VSQEGYDPLPVALFSVAVTPTPPFSLAVAPLEPPPETGGQAQSYLSQNAELDFPASPLHTADLAY